MKFVIEVAERLQSGLRDEDTVSRLGGDEFILVLPSTSADGAAHVAEKVLHAISLPYRVGPHELTITPSLGIAMYPADGETYETRPSGRCGHVPCQAGRYRDLPFFHP